jgi:hypothetical protein
MEKQLGKVIRVVQLLHDNDPLPKSQKAIATIRDFGLQKVNHQPHCPDMAPSDYFLVQNLKEHLHRHMYSSNDLKGGVPQWFEKQDKTPTSQEFLLCCEMEQVHQTQGRLY